MLTYFECNRLIKQNLHLCCFAVLKPEILEELEKLRDQELTVRRERRKKQAEQNGNKKEENKEANTSAKPDEGNKTVGWETSQMEVFM